MRPVIFYEWRRLGGDSHCTKVEKGEAIFHQFGCDYEKFESGAGNYSTAIIELSSGEVKNIPVENIKFISPKTDALTKEEE